MKLLPKEQFYFPVLNNISTLLYCDTRKKVSITWNESSYSKIILQKIFQFYLCYLDKECFVMHKDIWYPFRDIFSSALISRMKIKIGPKRTMFFILWTYFLFITTVFGNPFTQFALAKTCSNLKQYHNYEELTTCAFNLQRM